MSFLGLWVQTEDRQEVPPASWPLPELRVELPLGSADTAYDSRSPSGMSFGKVAALQQRSRESLFQWTRSSKISLESSPGRPGRRPLAALGSLAWSAVLPCPCRGRGLPPARQVLALPRPRTVHSHSSVGRTTPWGRVKMWPLSLRSSECNRGRRVTSWQPRCHRSACCSGGTGKHPREHHAAPP